MRKYTKWRPSGRKEGSMWNSSFREGSSVVTGDVAPPVSRTCNKPPVMFPTMMSPLRFHAPPTATLGRSHKVCGGPPNRSSFLSLPPASNATNLPSGDQNGGGVDSLASEPGRERTSSESIERIQRRVEHDGPAT